MTKKADGWDGEERRECAVHRLAFDGFNQALSEIKSCVAEIKRGVSTFVSWRLFVWVVGGIAGFYLILLGLVYQDHLRVSNKVQDNTAIMHGVNVKLDILLDTQKDMKKILNDIHK